MACYVAIRTFCRASASWVIASCGVGLVFPYGLAVVVVEV